MAKSKTDVARPYAKSMLEWLKHEVTTGRTWQPAATLAQLEAELTLRGIDVAKLTAPAKKIYAEHAAWCAANGIVLKDRPCKPGQ